MHILMHTHTYTHKHAHAHACTQARVGVEAACEEGVACVGEGPGRQGAGAPSEVDLGEAAGTVWSLGEAGEGPWVEGEEEALVVELVDLSTTAVTGVRCAADPGLAGRAGAVVDLGKVVLVAMVTQGEMDLLCPR